MRLLAHAQERIDAGDRVQASEKIWGAVAHKLQEIAKRRGWGWSSHDGFRRLANHLRKASGDPDLMTRFNAAEAFHVNFYQDARDLDELQDGLDNAIALVGLLEEANAMDKSVEIPLGPQAPRLRGGEQAPALSAREKSAAFAGRSVSG